MLSPEARDKASFHAYPAAIEGPKTSYSQPPGTNPVLRGFPLVAAGWAAAFISPLAGFLWNNAGFGMLRRIKDLNDYAPRYDPTVIPYNIDDNTSLTKPADVSYRDIQGPKSPNSSIGAYHAAYETGQISPTDVAKTLLDLIDENARHKVAFLSIVKENVLAAAELSTRRYKEGKAKGILDGVPVAIKDEVDLEGHPKTYGSAQDFTNPKNATSWCVRKWEEAGAIIIGKLNMHELGFGTPPPSTIAGGENTTGNNPIAGTPTNPHNPNYYPGGSSSASGTTVASNLLPLTLGCDGGGSIRVPSAYCGIYGLKPTHGRVSRSPTNPLAFSTGVTGPMASNMADLELGYKTLAIPNPEDRVSAMFAPPPPPSGARPRRTAKDDGKTRRVLGICKPWFAAAEPSVQSICQDALAYYRSSGYEMVDIDVPYLHQGKVAHAMTIMTEIGSTITDIHKFTPSNKILLAVGAKTPAQDFLLAQKMRNLLMSHLSYLFQKHPGLLIVTPTTPNLGWPISTAADLAHGVSDADMSLRSMTYVWLANFTGCPAISIPVGKIEGKRREGRVPVGLMAMGEWGDEESLLEWGSVGEEGSWGGNINERNRMERAEDWVDVLGIAKRR
ncbi:MAG: hypothetical protein Q9217_005013 [Psora testacea]